MMMKYNDASSHNGENMRCKAGEQTQHKQTSNNNNQPSMSKLLIERSI